MDRRVYAQSQDDHRRPVLEVKSLRWSGMFIDWSGSFNSTPFEGAALENPYVIELLFAAPSNGELSRNRYL
jgi:hypothetical protein